MRILLVQQESAAFASVAPGLQTEGFEVETVPDGATALASVSDAPPDLVVLDLALTTMESLEVCRRLRAESAVPVLVISGTSEEVDRVLGLEMGADDYVTRPFGMRELIARIRAIMRRVERAPYRRRGPLHAGDIEIDPDARTVHKAGVEVLLTPKEFDLLSFLARHSGQVFSRRVLLQSVWGYDYGSGRTVDVHMRWLRERIEDDPTRPRHLLTIRTIGYKFAG